VPAKHRTDRLTTAVQQTEHPEEFTRNYRALLKHYKIKGEKTQARSPHENGDIEQRHHRFKKAVEQSLLLRGDRDFTDRREYEQFLRKLFNQLNAGRKKRFDEELQVLNNLPAKRLEDYTRLTVKVGPSSTIPVKKCVYSVHSRLINENVEIRLYADHLELWYGQKKVDDIPRLLGEKKHHIQYRHIIDWLVRKPGAFENYRYRQDLFPSSHFRKAYDFLKDHYPSRANKEYLMILNLAAKETEAGVNDALRYLIEQGSPIRLDAVKALLYTEIPAPTEIKVDQIDLGIYDSLFQTQEVLS